MTDTRTVELWLDALNTVWAFDDGRGRTVRAYKCVEANEFPESLSDLANGPAVLSWPLTVKAGYGAVSSSIPTILIWSGMTEFHLTADIQKTNLAYILPFFGRIINAAKVNLSLGGRVEYFMLEDADNLQLSVLKYGDEMPHHGIVVRWIVKQNLSGQI